MLFKCLVSSIALQFPEHTRESYYAGILMGAGVMECDVVFTKDLELVCRHAQCDLHLTTNILLTSLAEKCKQPFEAANPSAGKTAVATCCTSDITLAEFRKLKGKMDGANLNATTPEEYVMGTPAWRTDLYASQGTLMSHADSIKFFKSFGTKFIPELKKPDVKMPYGDFTIEKLAQKVVDEYKAADVSLDHVYLQSFELEHIRYWIKNARPAKVAFLDERYDLKNLTNIPAEKWIPTMKEMKTMGIDILAPPMWALVTSDNGRIAPSKYALAAKAAGLKIVTWTLERTPPLTVNTTEYYYQSIPDLTYNNGAILEILHALVKDVGISGIFSDWPATTTFYANCMGLQVSE